MGYLKSVILPLTLLSRAVAIQLSRNAVRRPFHRQGLGGGVLSLFLLRRQRQLVASGSRHQVTGICRHGCVG